MCNCIKESEEQILAHLTERDKGKAIISKGAGFLNVAISFGKGPAQRGYDEFEYKTTRIKNDGSTGATQKKITCMYHTYCPFCGVKIEE
ncbi:hypothetical protein [Hymenobacter fodinae]|uniref:Uncharacterized protein n=1 Tax=Hymenobacter fodinae TaxID=2510796 RepID=A0A4Z0P6V5_9BACT|nr:hypothetical protein [Hymenobacter fodinae]TGE07740.1 hypothetical protein EU556_08275 [Hymenobacter fodinae]